MRGVTLPILAVPLFPTGCVLLEPTDPYAGMSIYRLQRRAATRPVVTEPAQSPLTLGEAIRVALVNNPEVAAMAHEVDVAKAQRDVAFGEVLPSLRAVSGYCHYLNSQRLIAARENGEGGLTADAPNTGIGIWLRFTKEAANDT